MALYKIILAYDGTNFQGFQRQEKGRTVQASIEEALRKIGWLETSIAAAGRTDSGVHATGQVISFEIDWKHSTGDLRQAMNANLPADVAAQSVEMVERGFHPRHSATARRYRYRIFCDQVRHPLRERYAWRVWPGVSVDLLNEAAIHLVGTFDFSAFGAPHEPGGSTIRQIFSSEWKHEGPDLVFEILGNAFLYHMVRRMVSFQMDVGQGKRIPGEIPGLLNGEEVNLVQGLAPAQGLVLSEVLYHPMLDEMEIIDK